MPGPWEKFQPPKDSAEGPWSKFGGGEKKPEALSTVDKVAKTVEDVGGAILSMPYVRGPLEFIGDKLERYVDAPVRAQISALQDGKSFGESIKAGGRQMGEKPLPTTRSGKEIMAKTGLPTTALSEYAPSLFSETGEGLKLKKGGILDASPAGVAGVLTQPSTFAIPAEAIIGATTKAAKAGGAVAKSVIAPAGPLVDLAKSAGKGLEKGVFKVGEVMTGGNLKAADALKASERLSGTQMLVPEAYLKGAGKKIGVARDAIEGSGKVLTAGDAAEKLSNVKSIIEAGELKAAKTPGSQQLLTRIEDALTDPKGIPVEAIDDMIRDLNTVEYTVQGNPKSIEPRWSKPLGQARGELEDLLKSTPEGAALSEAKAPYASLQDAKGRRSKLVGGLSWVGGIGGATIASSNPVLAAAAFAASRAIAPRTYYQIVGAAKLPAQAADALMAAYQTGKSSAIGEAMAQVAQRYPQEMAKITTAMAAESSRVADNDNAIKRRVMRMAE